MTNSFLKLKLLLHVPWMIMRAPEDAGSGCLWPPRPITAPHRVLRSPSRIRM